jgi:hypothetical protein
MNVEAIGGSRVLKLLHGGPPKVRLGTSLVEAYKVVLDACMCV